jgi:hypothetical protein
MKRLASGAAACSPLPKADEVVRARRSKSASDSIFKQPRGRAPALPRHDPPGLCQTSLIKRGRGECRARERTRSPVCETKKHTSKSHHRYGRHPAFPARWFTTYSTLSPAIGLFVTVVGLDSMSINANLIPASRHQDHMASPSARDISRQLMSRASIASRLTFRDDSAYVPLAEAGWDESIKLFLPFREANYFF